jgi:hypothetical protein
MKLECISVVMKQCMQVSINSTKLVLKDESGYGPKLRYILFGKTVHIRTGGHCFRRPLWVCSLKFLIRPSALGYKLWFGGSINFVTILLMIAFCFISTQNGGRNEGHIIFRSYGEHISLFCWWVCESIGRYMWHISQWRDTFQLVDILVNTYIYQTISIHTYIRTDTDLYVVYWNSFRSISWILL